MIPNSHPRADWVYNIQLLHLSNYSHLYHQYEGQDDDEI